MSVILISKSELHRLLDENERLRKGDTMHKWEDEATADFIAGLVAVAVVLALVLIYGFIFGY